MLNNGNGNSSPVAVDDKAETTVGTAVLIDVLANDYDPDGDPLQVVAFTMPAHGTVALVQPGILQYTPQAGFVGIDFFSYTISDGRQGKKNQSTAGVEVRVLAANTAPVAVDDLVTTTRDNPVTFDVRANDSDPDGDPLSITSFTMPAHGTLSIHADQRFTYTPAAGFVGEDGFSYTISDGRGGTAQATVTLVVEWPNTAPVAVDDRATTTQGTPVTIDVLANDSDADGDGPSGGRE
jgi:large repetitive protein